MGGTRTGRLSGHVSVSGSMLWPPAGRLAGFERGLSLVGANDPNTFSR